MTGPEQHADTVRENSKRVRDSIGFALAEKNIPRAPTWTLLVPQALDNIDEATLALAERAAALERERNEALDREAGTQDALDEAKKALHNASIFMAENQVAAEQARAEADRLREERDSARAAGRELAEERNQAMRITTTAREALERIAGQDCERFTDNDQRECVETKREPCDRCVALAAIITLEAAALAGPQTEEQT